MRYANVHLPSNTATPSARSFSISKIRQRCKRLRSCTARAREERKKKLENATMRTYHSRSIEDRLVVSGIELQRQKKQTIQTQRYIHQRLYESKGEGKIEKTTWEDPCTHRTESYSCRSGQEDWDRKKQCCRIPWAHSHAYSYHSPYAD